MGITDSPEPAVASQVVRSLQEGMARHDAFSGFLSKEMVDDVVDPLIEQLSESKIEEY